jgi:hypothetical protein
VTRIKAIGSGYWRVVGEAHDLMAIAERIDQRWLKGLGLAKKIAQPSLEALKKIALTLSVSLDALVFEDAERGPDEALKLKFEAVRQFDPDERKIAEGVLDSLINNHQAKRLFAKQSTEHSNS